MQTDMKSKKLTLTRKEAATLLGVSLVTLDRSVAKKKIPFLRIGSRVLFTQEGLEDYLRAKQEENAR